MDPDKSFKELLLTIYSSDSDARILAVRSLGKSKDTRAVDVLLSAMEDDDANIRNQAGLSLSELGEAAQSRLIEILLDPKQKASVRGTATWALANLSTPDSIQALMDVVNDTNEDVRFQAIDGLGVPGLTLAVDPLIRALQDKSSEIRWVAAGALGRIGDSQAVKPLLIALNDPEAVVRMWASISLGSYLHSPLALEPLILLLSDSDIEVREWAAHGLGELGDKEAINPLVESLNDPHSLVRAAAAKSLGELKGQIAIACARKVSF